MFSFDPALWSSQWLWLLLYFSFNLLLTLSNKSVLTTFPFPYTLTGLHTLCSTIGCCILQIRGVYTPKPLTSRNKLVLAAFSILYAINITISNVSLQLVTVPFHQVVRALTPIFTIFLSTLLLDIHTKPVKLLRLSPVILGVIIATYGDYYFTFWGFFLTLLGTFFAALKTIYTNVLQSPTKTSFRSETSVFSSRITPIWRAMLSPPSLGIHPLDLLMCMSPLAFIQCVAYAQLSGELDRLRQLSFTDPRSFFGSPLYETPGTHNFSLQSSRIYTHPTNAILAGPTFHTYQFPTLLLNGCIAFGLNVVSLTANGKIGALSMTVAANVKQVLTILFAVVLFDLTITPANALGITVTLVGGAWYAWGEYAEKQRRSGSGGGLTTPSVPPRNPARSNESRPASKSGEGEGSAGDGSGSGSRRKSSVSSVYSGEGEGEGDEEGGDLVPDLTPQTKLEIRNLQPGDISRDPSIVRR
ncbi:UAA transporter [Steccherinum ochraceum]|uniref:UAA transporter n=1 Tax=Steccherinum ochraceum TaxID=92696 RepID=A0A4R0RQA8_9APHY|nr:UAA transporter [Steccherinum ochraceum]